MSEIDYNDLFYQFVKKYSMEYKEKGTIKPEEMKEVFREFREIEDQFYKDQLVNFPEGFHVEGKELLNEMMETIRRYVYLPNLTDVLIVSLWIIHTYMFEAFGVSPYLAVVSPIKRCGKTRLMTLISYLSNNSLYASNLTPASIYRVVEEQSPTLLIDEFDSMWNERSESGEAFRGILNSGHMRNQSFVLRASNNGKVEKFQTFSPKAIAMIGAPPATIQDRSIVITMQRKPPAIKLPPLPLDWEDFFSLKQKIIYWVANHKEEIKKAYETVDIDLENDRARDNYRPLLAICHVISPEVAKALKKAIMQKEEPETEALIELLQDIKTVFEERRTDRLLTSELIEELCKIEESRWATYNYGKPITPRQLSLLLKPLGIKPTQLRVGNETGKRGYTFEMFIQAFQSYLPSTSDLSSTNSTNSTNGYRSQSKALQVSKGVEDANPLQKPNVEDVEDVEDKTGGVEKIVEDNNDKPDKVIKGDKNGVIRFSASSEANPDEIDKVITEDSSRSLSQPSDGGDGKGEGLVSFLRFKALVPSSLRERTDPQELYYWFEEFRDFSEEVIQEGFKRNPNSLELCYAFCKWYTKEFSKWQ